MNYSKEEDDQPRSDRSLSNTNFYSRLARYRSLLGRKWWVLVLGALAGLVTQGVISWSEAPSYSSVGRMIVSVKLNIAEGTVYIGGTQQFSGNASGADA